MSFLSSMFLLFGSLSTANADEYSNLDSDQYGLRVSMEEKGQFKALLDMVFVWDTAMSMPLMIMIC